MTWQQIATAPKDGSRLLLFPWAGRVVIGSWCYDEWRPIGMIEHMHPTYWMPLPDPPEPDIQPAERQ